MKNWKTTALGIVMFVQALSTAIVAVLDANPATNPDWSLVVTAGMAAVGFIMAKDTTEKK